MAVAELLRGIRGGRVLDMATGAGGFVETLAAGLDGWTEIVGIDTNPARGEAFAEAFAARPGIRFELRDAAASGYDDGAFDTVAVASSLHHLASPDEVVAEAVRLLRPGGHLVVSEMYRDGQGDAQMTHVLLHHWWAAVDRRRGIVHRETFTRAEVLALVRVAGLDEMLVADVADDDEDPHDPATLDEIDEVIDRYLAWADGDDELVHRGADLRHRLRTVGILGASSLLAVSRKPVPPRA